MKTETVLQDIDVLKQRYPRTNITDIDFIRHPNNWLKRHGKPMRRKPFKRKYLMLDEFANLY